MAINYSIMNHIRVYNDLVSHQRISNGKKLANLAWICEAKKLVSK